MQEEVEKTIKKLLANTYNTKCPDTACKFTQAAQNTARAYESLIQTEYLKKQS